MNGDNPRPLGLYLLLIAILPGFAPGAPAEKPDAFMGDWQGTRRTPGGERPLAAQVIALGGGRYRAIFLDTLIRRTPPLATFEGKQEGPRVIFAAGAAVIENQRFAGKLPEGGGTFTLTPLVRTSPTLGAAPPPGAVVLFAGTDLDAWRPQGPPPGLADLNGRFGKSSYCAGYLRNEIYAPMDMQVVLLAGSDDGVKIWLGGKLIHALDTPRSCKPGQDEIPTSLRKGWNPLVLKVVQGGGDWQAHVRFVGTDGNPPTGLKAKIHPTGTDEAGGIRDGVILAWEAAGPYRLAKRDDARLFREAFLPEHENAAGIHWKLLDSTSGRRRGWRILEDGTLEIVPGSGPLISREKFGDCRLHLEFRLPFLPDKRGQQRGNSGVYLQGRYEVQVLDSYGLEGRDNECGGIYKVAAPRVNMCLPPTRWQTYDILFRAPRFDAGGKKIADARITVRHNGVLIHDNVALPGPTGGALPGNPAAPGPLMLQDHGNPVQFRNIWIVPRLPE